MKTKVLLIGLLISITFALVGCGTKMLNEETIKNAVKNEMVTILKSDEIIESIEILERKTNEEQNEDNIIAQIISNDGSARYTQIYEIAYALQDKEWIINDFTPKKKDEWGSVPIAGADISNIYELLMGRTFEIEGEEWRLDGTNIGDIKEISRDTQLDHKYDAVTVSIELLSDVLRAQGEIKLTYFYNSGWHINDITVVKAFETSYQEGKDLDITNELILEALTQMSLAIGDRWQGTLQNINIVKEEVAELVIKNIAISDVGALKSCVCSFDLNKPIASCNISAVVEYRYDVAYGWKVEDVWIADWCVLELNLDALKGEWRGHMAELQGSSTPTHSVVLEITDISNEEGTVNAIIKIPSEKRSCVLKGYVDFIDLSIKMVFEEWIEKPKENALMSEIHQPTLYGIVLANDATIKCIDTMESNTFELEKIN